MSSKYNFQLQEFAFRSYISDAAYYINKRLGVDFKKRYYDIIHPTVPDERSGDEIASDIIERLGLKVVDSNGLDDPADQNRG